MLRITASKNSAGAAAYFESGLSKGDYYTDQETVGVWGGKAAERLGLSGEVQKADFVALVHNETPEGEKLNPRNGDNRKCGYDFTFSVSKSVSVVYALNDDVRIAQAFEQAVEETMRELETDIRCQEGQGKEKRLTKTGEMIWASFTHKTSRPVDDVADPHLHRHCFAINTTWNENEQRFQAAEFSTIKKIAPYYEAAFDSRFADKMVELGYDIERRGLSWEIANIEDGTCAKFSRRTAEVEKAAAHEQQKNGTLSLKQKAQLGAMTRAKKTLGHSWQQLKKIWQSWLSGKEVQDIENALKPRSETPVKTISAMEAVTRAEEHLFERKSVVQEYQLKTEALKRSFGEHLPEAIHEAIKQGEYIHHSKGDTHYVTTPEAVKEEERMLAFIRESKGTHRPINAEYHIENALLTKEQQAAVMHALTDQNQVTLISGGAGTGKTTLMKELRSGVVVTGKAFYGFAPTAAASRGVMRKEGFHNSDTLANLLTNSKLQQKMKDSVIWIDESGLLGVKDMNHLFAIAKEQNARLILTGDTRQHTAVARGDALRILESEGKVKVARVSKIQRQKHNPRFKQVVVNAAKGNLDKALHQLDNQGGVLEVVNGKKRLQALAEEYCKLTSLKKSCLVIAPTHIEGRDVTQAIRQELKQKGLLDDEERSFTSYRSSHLSEEQKSDPFHYGSSDKMILEFHQNARGFKKGERWEIGKNEQGERVLKGDHHDSPLPLAQSNRYTLYRPHDLKIAAGDKIRITKNAKTQQGTRIHNGQIYRVTGFTAKGDIRLHTGKTLNKDFGHLDYGYLRTSHSSQGMTVDRVLIAQSSLSFGAASQQQAYVSLSRAREGAKIFTDDKHALEKAILRDGKRRTAREIAQERDETLRRHKPQKQNQLLTTEKQKSHGNAISL